MFGAKRAVAVILAAGAMAFAANPGDPVAVIKKKDAELQKMLRDKEAVGKADPKRTERLKALINGIFDFEELGKRALGTETWKTMTPDQQKRFVKAFKDMVENASVKKLEVYQSDSSTYEPPEIAEGKASVTAHVWSKGTESIVTYKLLSRDTTWKAWDLVIDDLSTARNYGEQFKKILQTSNVDGLIAKLEKKANESGGAAPADNLKAKSEKAPGAAPAPAKAAPAKASAPKGASAAPAKAPASAPSSAPAKGPAAAAPAMP
jgi:phospholipid transport system substrate-binding protein